MFCAELLIVCACFRAMSKSLPNTQANLFGIAQKLASLETLIKTKKRTCMSHPWLNKGFNTGCRSTFEFSSRCDAWRELVPAADSGYATRQSARFLNINKHLDLWNGFVSVLISGFLTPPPSLLCLHTQFQLFNFNKLIFIFYYFRVRLQGFSEKKCV